MQKRRRESEGGLALQKFKQTRRGRSKTWYQIPPKPKQNSHFLGGKENRRKTKRCEAEAIRNSKVATGDGIGERWNLFWGTHWASEWAEDAVVAGVARTGRAGPGRAGPGGRASERGGLIRVPESGTCLFSIRLFLFNPIFYLSSQIQKTWVKLTHLLFFYFFPLFFTFPFNHLTPLFPKCVFPSSFTKVKFLFISFKLDSHQGIELIIFCSILSFLSLGVKLI